MALPSPKPKPRPAVGFALSVAPPISPSKWLSPPLAPPCTLLILLSLSSCMQYIQNKYGSAFCALKKTKIFLCFPCHVFLDGWSPVIKKRLNGHKPDQTDSEFDQIRTEFLSVARSNKREHNQSSSKVAQLICNTLRTIYAAQGDPYVMSEVDKRSVCATLGWHVSHRDDQALCTHSKTLLLPSDQTTKIFKGASLWVCPTRSTWAFVTLPTACPFSLGATCRWYCGFLMYERFTYSHQRSCSWTFHQCDFRAEVVGVSLRGHRTWLQHQMGG